MTITFKTVGKDIDTVSIKSKKVIEEHDKQ